MVEPGGSARTLHYTRPVVKAVLVSLFLTAFNVPASVAAAFRGNWHSVALKGKG